MKALSTLTIIFGLVALALTNSGLWSLEQPYLQGVRCAWERPLVLLGERADSAWQQRTSLNAGDELPGHRSAHHLVLKDKACPRRQWLYLQLDHRELATPAGLFHQATFSLGRAGDRLIVGHLRTAHVCVHAKLASHAIQEHVQVQFPHSGQDGLVQTLIRSYLKGGILLGQAL